MYVRERFVLNDRTEDHLRSLIPSFGYDGFGELVFYRTYSRIKGDGGQENWADVVNRVTNGTFSIRKDWYIKNRIHWEEGIWQAVARKFAISMFQMKWMPPGRGLWAMGSDFVYERGSMALYNCGALKITDEIGDCISWLMDSLMHGVGVGFEPVRNNNFRIYNPVGTFDYIIPDSREGWCLSEKLLINAFTKPNQRLPRMIYDKVREAGLPIKGFGGISSGPGPLRDLHERTISEFEKFGTRQEYDSVYLKTNLANHTGCCVVAGNVRRSAELAKGKVRDPIFMDLKNYDRFPEREAFGWMSNNSVELESDEDFQMLGEIAERIRRNGEPGYINRVNMRVARVGKKMGNLRYDDADLFNPCGEIPLEDRETCNVAETLPTMCTDEIEWLDACRHASLYTSTVSLLPTHQHSTNRVIARNRRIGVSIVDFSGWKHEHGVHKVTRFMRDGYKEVRKTNKWANEEAGVPLAIRVTTIKPGGTTPKLPGRTSGIGNPTFDFTLRRIRVAKNSPVHTIVANAGVPYEQDVGDPYTDVFEFPILQGPAPPAENITLWEQAMTLILVQREWADNAVSNTLYYRPMWRLIEEVKDSNRFENYIGVASATSFILKQQTEFIIPERYKITVKYKDGKFIKAKIFEFDPKHEERDVEPVLSAIAPHTKSVAVLPHSPMGVYPQMPEEGITESEYHYRRSQISSIDWSELSGSDGIDERYCSGPMCETAPSQQ